MSSNEELEQRILGLEAALRELQRGGAGVSAGPGLIRLGQAANVNGDLTVTGAIHGAADSALNADTLDGLHAASFGQFSLGSWAATFTGFSVNPVGIYRYALVGKLCTVAVHMSAFGTSNAPTFYISAPFAASNAAGMYWEGLWAYGYDGGVLLATPGRVYIPAGGTFFLLDKSLAAPNWTASGNKLADFTFQYEIQ